MSEQIRGIGLQLAELSLGQGRAQVEIADALEVSTKHVNLVWNGKVQPSLAFARRWADYLGYEVVFGLQMKP